MPQAVSGANPTTKTMRARNLTSMALFILATAALATADDGQRPNEGTIRARLHGVYGFVAMGTRGVPFSAVGLFRPKDNGTFDGQATDNFSGRMVADTFQGTLQFDSQRTGTLAGTTSLGESFSKSFIVTDGGNEIWFESTDNGDVEVITATRQVRRRFTARDLRGTWGFACNGSDANPQTGVAQPVSALGTLSWDAAGKFSGRGTYNSNGSIAGATFTGSSTVNPDGTFDNNGNYLTGLQGSFADSGVIETGSQLATISISSRGAIVCSYKKIGR